MVLQTDIQQIHYTDSWFWSKTVQREQNPATLENIYPNKQLLHNDYKPECDPDKTEPKVAGSAGTSRADVQPWFCFQQIR